MRVQTLKLGLMALHKLDVHFVFYQGINHCFLNTTRHLYSVLPCTGFPRDLGNAWDAFIQQEQHLQQSSEFFEHLESVSVGGKFHTHIRQLHGSMARFPPLLEGACYPPSFISFIHPIMHNVGHVATDCAKYIDAHVRMNNVPNPITSARSIGINKSHCIRY